MQPEQPGSVGVLRYVLGRYNRNSVVALGCLAALYLGVFVIWHELVDYSRGMDWLLGAIWAGMTALLVWDIDARRDVPLVIVAFFGGLVIEWWGTTTELWSYYTVERPPLWILPAWPVAALAIERIARVIGHALPAWTSPWPFFVVSGLFTAAMIQFAAPSWHIVSTQVVIALMISVTLSVREPRREFVIFLAGSFLGIFLEYWGTSRWCWRYYTHEVPPWQAVIAHGFASVAFTRGWQILDVLRRRFG